MTKSLPQKFASFIMVLKKLESKVGERRIVRNNLAALISVRPVRSEAFSELLESMIWFPILQTRLRFDTLWLDEDLVKIIVYSGSGQTRQIDLVYDADYKLCNRYHKDIPLSLVSFMV